MRGVGSAYILYVYAIHFIYFLAFPHLCFIFEGPWGTGGRRNFSADGGQVKRFWKLDRREDPLRRHFKLRVNLRGSRYVEASPNLEAEKSKSSTITPIRIDRFASESQLLLDLKVSCFTNVYINYICNIKLNCLD